MKRDEERKRERNAGERVEEGENECRDEEGPRKGGGGSDLRDALFMGCEKIRYDPICGPPIPTNRRRNLSKREPSKLPKIGPRIFA